MPSATARSMSASASEMPTSERRPSVGQGITESPSRTSVRTTTIRSGSVPQPMAARAPRRRSSRQKRGSGLTARATTGTLRRPTSDRNSARSADVAATVARTPATDSPLRSWSECSPESAAYPARPNASASPSLYGAIGALTRMRFCDPQCLARIPKARVGGRNGTPLRSASSASPARLDLPTGCVSACSTAAPPTEPSSGMTLSQRSTSILQVLTRTLPVSTTRCFKASRRVLRLPRLSRRVRPRVRVTSER
jgi:hypothetical protein